MSRALASAITAAVLLGAVSVRAEERAPPRLTKQAKVGPGTLVRSNPAPREPKSVEVGAFLLDTVPVTNADFLRFVLAQPTWQRGRAAALFVDATYLQHWTTPTNLGGIAAAAPVTNVSWFAARAYCAWQGGRLPSTDEWELAAAASKTIADARSEPAFVQQILGWYATRQTTSAVVGKGEPNLWAIRDLHGLVWEWTEDFDSAFVTADNRDQGRDVVRYCGGGAADATNPADYASFMRLAFRSSLEARFAVPNLGFRCARSSVGGAR